MDQALGSNPQPAGLPAFGLTRCMVHLFLFLSDLHEANRSFPQEQHSGSHDHQEQHQDELQVHEKCLSFQYFVFMF